MEGGLSTVFAMVMIPAMIIAFIAVNMDGKRPRVRYA